MRRLARRAARVSDRALHGLRRRSLLRKFERRGRPTSVLFVCHGNICRSPFAAGLMRQLLPAALRGAVTVESAGFVGAYWPSPREAIEVAAEWGVDLSHHRARLLTPALVRAAQVIVVMDSQQRREICALYRRRSAGVLLLGDLDPLDREARAIRDPVDQPAAVFRQVYSRIARCVAEFVRAVTHAEAAGPR